MRQRKLYSIKNELIEKSREAMLSAVQIFNNPQIQFKSETFIVLAIIAWTYLLHAYYKHIKIDYRYYEKPKTKKVYNKTKRKAYKYWELERCLDDSSSPIDNASESNLKFLIGLRHEIEHQMTTKIDNLMSGKFQSCCLNYNHYIKEFFGDLYGIEKSLSLSLQFSSLSEEQVDELTQAIGLPQNIKSFIIDYDDAVSQDIFNDPKYSYRTLIFQKLVNRKGQADRVIEFIDPKSEIAQGVGKEYRVQKEIERPKFLPKKVISILQNEGYINFGIGKHTRIWKELDGKNLSKGYGVLVEGNRYWYENRFNVVREYLKKELSLSNV